MTLWIRKQPDAALKLGVVASRRVGGAVQRNRAKRLLREAWRLNRHHFAGGVDVILSARSDIVKVALADVVSELMYLGSKTGLLDRKETP
jgi:ribonuclease P protein component